MKRLLWMLLIPILGFNTVTAQIASFNFSAASQTVAGWTNVAGDPSVAIRTATDPSGVMITSVARGNWSASTSGICAYNGNGGYPGVYFPAGVMSANWFQYNGSGNNLALYNAVVPQLELSGLNKDSSYIIRMSGSDIYSGDPTVYTVAGASVAGSQSLNIGHNTTQGVTFQHVYPDATGMIKVYINATSSTSYAFLCGLQIFKGTANVGVPVIALTAPANGSRLAEGGNFNVLATASETGGTIAKVEFYADTAKIGEADAAPYTMTWNDPAPGSYQLTAKATDNVGTISTSSVNIAVESLNYFWSTTGNIATGGDTSFVGTVDSNRLAFRTKNVERMSILPTGKIGIGTISPTAQLHTTGTVRMGGLVNDSTQSQPRMLVSDTSGNLFYRAIGSSGLSGGVGAGLGQTAGGVALGDSIPGPGAHSFNSNRYQYLNGYQYSIGGSVNDPVNQPVFRMYNNGDLAVGTTMDAGVNTAQQAGLRYYSKLGVLQIGATDRLDTTVSKYVYSNFPGSGILINTDGSNTIKGRIYSSIISGDGITVDTLQGVYWSYVSGESMHIGGTVDHSLITGYGHQFPVGGSNLYITGQGNQVLKPGSAVLNVSGYSNVAEDTARGSLIGGADNQYGGLFQFSAGLDLTNRTPSGAMLGSGNVDFSTLPYTGLQGISAPGLAGYPLFAIGNSIGSTSIHSNAVTVLYNGRTQINTTGMTVSLTQTAATPQAALDVVSTNTGVLLPRLSTAQRNAIVSGDLKNGLLLYNTDSSAFQYYNGSAWNSVGSGSSSSGRWLFAGGTVYDTLDNLAIGTSNPQGYKLAVNGTAIFTKVVVKPAGSWPDYVFKKGYALQGLDELECYIREHQHLPGVASEQEVQREGIDLGAQQTAMLKKVEELTLYLIRENKTLTQQNKQMSEQNKQLSEQNTRLEAQQKEIDELTAMIQDNNKH